MASKDSVGRISVDEEVGDYLRKIAIDLGYPSISSVANRMLRMLMDSEMIEEVNLKQNVIPSSNGTPPKVFPKKIRMKIKGIGK